MTPTPQIAFIFPGQGSQVVGMGRELAKAYPVARQVFEQADDLLSFPLSRLMWEGPAEELNDTVNTQPALLTHSVAALRVFAQCFPDVQPVSTAGHSMGELSALVAAGILPFAEALALVRLRGEQMKHAGQVSPGGMAAILGLDIPTLDRLCAEASQAGEIVQVANDNCPGQVVISGSTPALERALELAQAAGARKAVALAVSIPAHSPLMAPAQAGFNAAVEAAPIADPRIPLVGNVTAEPLTTAAQVRADLQAQLTHRVRWTESIQTMIGMGANRFIELGPGAVLCGLLKRIDRTVTGNAAGNPEDFEKLSDL